MKPLKFDNISENEILEGLLLAKARYGNTLDVTGNSQFLQCVIQLVHKHKLDIKFTDENMNRVLNNLKQPVALKVLKKTPRIFQFVLDNFSVFLFFFLIGWAFYDNGRFVVSLSGVLITMGIILFFAIGSIGSHSSYSGGSNRQSHSHGGSSASNSGYAPYQGDRSQVGGVVGGSITPPVGGRAGQ